jgi:cytochrome c oxidase subunit II
MRIIKSIITLLSIVLYGFKSFANYPKPWQMNLQEAASPVMKDLTHLHDILLYICFGIPIFVLLLLLYICLRYNKKANPVPSKNSHNTPLEIIWTVLPAIILIVIAIPSIKALYYADKIPETEMTIKVVGRQWFWQYAYPDHDNIAFDSYMINDADIKPGQIRLLEVDNRVVVPINTSIKVLITGGDVIHSWAVPALGVKTDAIPGRLNQTWINITKPGVYYGQCSELCGINHAFMPIAIEAVTKEDFDAWVASAKTKFSS